MNDPFLASHHVGPRCYSIGGRISPVSIRDQIVRAQLLVDRAHELQLISEHCGDRFLIVGAGAGGIAAALRAAAKRVPTILLEQHDMPFGLQAHCTSRWLDPTQYDWPIDHWKEGKVPWNAIMPAMSLHWTTPDWAHKLAQAWTLQLTLAARQHSALEIKYHSQVKEIAFQASGTGYATAKIEERDSTGQNMTTTGRYSLILLAVGFGEEKCYIHKAHPTRGIPFWATDGFQLPDLGTGCREVSVLISGSGDGSLQDFLRITTGRASARKLYNACGIPHQLERKLQSELSRFQNAYVWSRQIVHDCGPLVQLHSVFSDVTSEALQSVHVKSNIARLIRDTIPEIKLVYPCTHFSLSYGLNRFLVLLIGRYLEELLKKPVFYPKRVVGELAGVAGHTCRSNANTPPDPCHGADHLVQLLDCPTCGSLGSSMDDAEQFTANVLILRHGIDPSAFATKFPPAFMRHAVPFSPLS